MPPHQCSSSSTNPSQQQAQPQQQCGKSSRQHAPAAPTTTSTPDIAGSSAAAPTEPLQPIEEEIDLTNVSVSEDDNTPDLPDANQAPQSHTMSTRNKMALDIKHFFNKTPGQDTFCDTCQLA